MNTTWKAFTDFWVTVMRDEPIALISWERMDNGKTFGAMADPKQLREMAATFTRTADILEKRAACKECKGSGLETVERDGVTMEVRCSFCLGHIPEQRPEAAP